MMKVEVMAALVMSIGGLASARGEKWAGLYEMEGGGMVAIGEMHEFGHDEILVDYTTGETGPLFELDNGRVGVGRAIADKTPPAARILERKEGQVFLDGRRLKSIAMIRQPFRTRNGDVELAGELVRPRDTSRGVIVMVHGSGDGPRRAYDLWTNFFVASGWAAVVFDKRGSGESTGDWHDADFGALAGDVRKVLKWARGEKDLAGLKVGLWGASQAGWIVPQLSAENAVDFAVIQAGPSIPSDEFVRSTLESELRAYGFPPEEIAKAVRYYDLDAAVSRGRKPLSEVEKAYAEASAAGAEWLLKPPDPIKSPDRRFMAAITGFDPAPFWRKTRTPLLIVFGGKDHVVPVEANRPRLETLLAEAGNTRAEIVVLENDNHLNMLAKTGLRTEYPSLNRFDPDYFKTLRAYLTRMAGK
jgi:alpha-beta hydrolase superfamily lysophospholipase